MEIILDYSDEHNVITRALKNGRGRKQERRVRRRAYERAMFRDATLLAFNMEEGGHKLMSVGYPGKLERARASPLQLTDLTQP